MAATVVPATCREIMPGTCDKFPVVVFDIRPPSESMYTKFILDQTPSRQLIYVRHHDCYQLYVYIKF